MRNHCKRVSNKNTRKVSAKVKSDECPNNVCPIDKKKKKNKGSSVSKGTKSSKSLYGKFLDFVFPSRLSK